MAFIPLYDTNPLRNIKRPFVAWGLIALNILVYFFVQGGTFLGDPNEASVLSFGLIPSIFNGFEERPIEFATIPDIATIVTYSFLHGSFWHLAGNMIFLWVFADNVEDALGHFRYVIFYLLCAAAAGYAFVLSAPGSEAPVIGASGAVAGNIGAYLLLHPRAKIWVLIYIPVRVRAVWVLGFWIIFQFIAALANNGEDEVAWWAHVGGLIAGAILVLFMRQRGVPLFAPSPNAPTPRPSAAQGGMDGPPPTMATPAVPLEPRREAPDSDRPKGPWG